VIESFFWREVGSHYHGHHEFDSAAHRRYFERAMRKLLAQVSALAALAIKETLPVGRFDTWLLCEGKPKALAIEKIAEKLNTAFNGARFQLIIEEAR
jgi:hypothetical protein